MDEFVTKDACQRTRDAMTRDMNKMDCQIEELMDMKEAIARLTVIQEQYANRQKFWESDSGKLILRVGLFIVVIIVLVALGQDTDLVDKLKGVK